MHNQILRSHTAGEYAIVLSKLGNNISFYRKSTVIGVKRETLIIKLLDINLAIC
ncbi:MAG: hypothetical protein V7L28_09350 [Nostoc sp.]